MMLIPNQPAHQGCRFQAVSLSNLFKLFVIRATI